MAVVDERNGIRGIVKSVGLETQFDIGQWRTTDRFRFDANSGEYNERASMVPGPATLVGLILGGPKAVQAIADPATINDNGPLSYAVSMNARLNDLSTTANGLRASRVWNVGRGKLTTTGGVCYSARDIDMFWTFASIVHDLAVKGQSALVNVIAANDTPVTQNGVSSYAVIQPISSYRRCDVNYRVIPSPRCRTVRSVRSLSAAACGSTLARSRERCSGPIWVMAGRSIRRST